MAGTHAIVLLPSCEQHGAAKQKKKTKKKKVGTTESDDYVGSSHVRLMWALEGSGGRRMIGLLNYLLRSKSIGYQDICHDRSGGTKMIGYQTICCTERSLVIKIMKAIAKWQRGSGYLLLGALNLS